MIEVIDFFFSLWFLIWNLILSSWVFSFSFLLVVFSLIVGLVATSKND